MPAQIEAFTSVRIFEAILSKVENPGSSSPAFAVDDAGNFATAGEGWYRVRVQARGRDEGNAQEGDDLVEEHLLSVWPAPPQPDVVHIADDTFARSHYDPTRPPAHAIQP
ncbi:hypothetical protein [Streptomyces sp. NPDC018833]|uniref:hypothetical protein n=1 Tax=Streptomyces sp. NPDC018833 TaxID=3365053 RepID=UPI003787F762